MVLECQSDHESEWAANLSITAKIGCTTETLRRWMRQSERDSGQHSAQASSERDRGGSRL